jgi:ribosomal protein S27AE
MTALYPKKGSQSFKYYKVHYQHPIFERIGYCLRPIADPSLITACKKKVSCGKCLGKLRGD